MPTDTVGYAALKAKAPLAPFKYTVRDCGAQDVHIGVKFCGICHSDIHSVRDEWFPGTYPMVPGHEVLGQVKAVGSEVKKFKVGDWAAVGCMVDSCRTCSACKRDEENLCKDFVLTYGAKNTDGSITYGGYGKDLVCDQRFAVQVPDSFTAEERKRVAPLLCAGITVYSPMKRYGADKPGCRIGVMGLGGLGHMAVKFGVAFGNEVTVISHSAAKKDQACKELGATHFVNSTDAEQMKAAAGSLDFIIDTIAAHKNLEDYMSLLAVGGTLTIVGLSPGGQILQAAPFPMIMGQKRIAGSVIGGMKATQEMVNFCAEKKVLPMCEMVKAQDVEAAFERCIKSDVRFRFVIDHENSQF